jgi:hypothetical protein
MIRLLSLSVTAAAAMLASAAPAEPPAGSRDAAAENAALRVMHSYSACIARARPDWAEAMIALPLMSEEQDAAVRRGQRGERNCLGYSGLQLTFRPRALVGGMAEYLIGARYRDATLEPVARLTEEQELSGPLAARNGYESLGLCVVRRNPGGVRDLLRTRVASGEERAAARRLAPDLGPCLPQGQQLAFDASGLRGVLAVGLYRALAALTPPTGRN